MVIHLVISGNRNSIFFILKIIEIAYFDCILIVSLFLVCRLNDAAHSSLVPVMSSINWNFTSTFFIPLYSIFSFIVRNQVIWPYNPSTDKPTNLQPASSNFFSRLANVINSDVQTGVKSAGWLNRITQFPLYSSWKLIVLCVVAALNEGALSPMRGMAIISWFCVLSVTF